VAERLLRSGTVNQKTGIVTLEGTVTQSLPTAVTLNIQLHHGPYGAIQMGGMFTILKVREGRELRGPRLVCAPRRDVRSQRTLQGRD
jgi:hypothetical protein